MFSTSQYCDFTDAKQLFVASESLQFSNLFPREFAARERACVIWLLSRWEWEENEGELVEY